MFDPAEFLGSADCIKHLPVLNKACLVSCARWLGIQMRAADTKGQLLVAVQSKVAQGLAEAEHLVGEIEIPGSSDSEHEGSMIDDDDRISVNAGLTLFEDPPRTGTIYEGQANLPRKLNASTNPFISVENLAPEDPLVPVRPLVESKEDGEFNLICKRIELMKLEFEENERARRHELEMANINLEMARLQSNSNNFSTPRGISQDKFNVGEALKLVPVFDELNVPEFFKAFERVATRLSWPPEMWTVLIQCRLVGKAIRVYNALEEGIARDYHKVKALVLKAYDLVPEAYRLKFRNFAKQTSLTYVEFARLKEQQFDDWLKSRQVVSFSSLRELMLLEEFKKSCSKELKIYLEEVKAVNLSKAAQIADEFVLTHRTGSGSFGNKDVNFQSARPVNFQRRSDSFVNTRGQGNPPDKNHKPDSNQEKVSSGQDTRVFFEGNRFGSGPGNMNNRGRGTCFWCNKQGHYQAQCNARKRYLQRNNNNPVSLISTGKPDISDPIIENCPVASTSNGSSSNSQSSSRKES